MRETFYRIKRKGTLFFYEGYTLRVVRKQYKFGDAMRDWWYNVEDKIKWSTVRFWSCLMESTVKRHLDLIQRLEGVCLDDLMVQKCTIGRVEDLEAVDFYGSKN